MTGKVEFSKVSKSFGAVKALVEFDLSIEEGELVTLLGPSGCGKSTALRVAAGFETPDSGDVSIGGASILAQSANKRGIGMVFQNYSLFPHLTVTQNLEFGMRVRNIAREKRSARVGELLELVRLSGLSDRYPHQISGGQQQRVALARALAVEPRVLLLDEPLSALDATVRIEVREEIRRIQRASGIATIFVTHDQEEALAISDRICVMSNGKIEQVGAPDVVYRSPSTEFVARFVGKVNDIEVEVLSSTKARLRGHKHEIEIASAGKGGGAGGAAGGSAVVGGVARLLIRPEDVQIVRPDSARANVRGTVKTIHFGGATTTADVEIDGTTHLVRIADSTRNMQFRVGDAVHVAFDTERALLTRGGAA
ncbi:MAG: ABC transporter ATP-binding protein [Actinomycetota bacterium]